MMQHSKISDSELFKHLKQGKIKFASNARLKIYGTLHCSSGKRMHKQNRVFFKNEEQALKQGFRPCGHCLPAKYAIWKSSQG